MPFTGVSVMDRKLEFVRLALAPEANRRELCRRFGVSPTLAYRLIDRYRVQGAAGLEERSRRPLVSPERTSEAVEAQVLAVRAEHPAWGGRKIVAVLKRRGMAAPAPSTVTAILRRHGVELGADERFHRTLKAEALAGPPFEDIDQAARHLDRWRCLYNTERPHEALGMLTPIERYAPSPRPYRPTIEPFDYGPDDRPRRVPADGRISFNAGRWRVPKAFRGKIVAVRPTSTDGLYDVVFRTTSIAAIDLRDQTRQSQSVTDVPEHPSPMSPV